MTKLNNLYSAFINPFWVLKLKLIFILRTTNYDEKTL